MAVIPQDAVLFSGTLRFNIVRPESHFVGRQNRFRIPRTSARMTKSGRPSTKLGSGKRYRRTFLLYHRAGSLGDRPHTEAGLPSGKRWKQSVIGRAPTAVRRPRAAAVREASQLITTIRFRKVNIVVLDEATSNMDTRTDLQAQLAFRDTFSNQTLLLVTHRVHNVADMDAILRVDEGQVESTQLGFPPTLCTDLCNPRCRLSVHSKE